MRPRRILTLLASALLTASASAQQLVWSDEFDGTSLDLSKWEHQIGTGCPSLCGWGNNELQYYRSQNVTVSGGLLRITARQQSFGGSSYTSGRIRTRGDLGNHWTYGRFEVRARLPQGQGLWPAIWMLPTDYVYGGWAASGEIDIMELVGHEPNRVHGTLHYGNPWPGNVFSGSSTTLPSGTFADSFHVFAIEWEPTEIRWYLDGVQYAAQSSWWSGAGAYPAPFDQNFHLLLNVAVGGNWPGNPNGSTQFPQTMEVDYVRVYQGTGGGPVCAQDFDDMEHGNPNAFDWFTFDGGSISGAGGNVPPFEGGSSSLAATATSNGSPGYQGGFGRTRRLNLEDATHFEFWIQPDAGLEGVYTINLQDDDNGDNTIPNPPTGADDEFHALLSIGGPGSDIVAGGGWQHVIVPLADFEDDNSYLWGGNGVLDAVPTSAGGNGQLINVVIALSSANGNDITLRTDAWRFTRRAGSISGVVYDDRDGNGTRDALEPGLGGVQLELFDALRGTVVSSVTTDVSGSYSLPDATQGFVQVRIVSGSLPAGSTATEDPDGVESLGLASYLLACDESAGGQDFGFQVPNTLGTRYCSPAAPNSTGMPARLDLRGSAVLGANNLRLEASQLPPNQLGMFLTSANVGNTPVGAGVLCVSGPFGRLGGPLFSGAQGRFTRKLDLSQSWPVPGVTAPMVGETWHFTTWYRDVAGVTNFSDAMSVTFQ